MAGSTSPAGEVRPLQLRRALIALCITEITSWGVLYYAFPVMLPALTHATGWPAAAAMGAFSTGLVVSALAGVPVGRLLDRYGPRLVMTVGSVAGLAAVLAIAAAPTLPWFFAAWVLAGLAQSAVLYPPAFAALTRWHGPQRVRALTTLSLVAGLSSTVFAPLTAVLVARLDWRMACIGLAVLLGAVTIPLHALCLTPPWPAQDGLHPGHSPGHAGAVLHSRPFALLVVAMVLGVFGMGAATLNLVPLFASRGSGATLGAIALGLCGAGQVMGRLGYSTLTRWTTPAGRAMAVLAAGSLTVALLAALPGPDAALIAAAVLAGCARGLYTLLQATAISDRWGTRHFATINGVFSAPTTLAVALAPAGGALLADRLGSYTTCFYLLAILVLAGAATAAATAVRAPGLIRGSESPAERHAPDSRPDTTSRPP